MRTGQRTTMNADQQRQRAINEHRCIPGDPFVYGVVTTGIFCLPTCPSRRPRTENIRLFDNDKAALQDGYRPCRRCHPLGNAPSPATTTVIALCRAIDMAERKPTLAELSAQSGWTPFHLQRQFKAITGISPHQYGVAVRRRRVRQQLRDDQPLTHAAHHAGFDSSSHLHSSSGQTLGMKPGQYRKAGKGLALRVAIADSSLGAVLVAESKNGICAVAMGDDPDALLRDFQQEFSGAEILPGNNAFDQRVAMVITLIDQPLGTQASMPDALPLDIRGTAFQEQVWAMLRSIPAGQTLSYQALAEKLGRPTAARAVARACASNRLAVLVPCHRIVRADGGLSGYRWGVERKAALLGREQGQEQA
ncbi:bifunctional DNA-binding transcriptional regulator/O6-methylguanine-DNA methyltransferase Ada [Alcanivorax sp. HI0044]|uniref:bifunctional DNA-binding transcriptional regulator/O6-methylguanine-DNA methyltransferase Ada n=3 Tax=Alcanivorax TaxID=59753 RepID=UPI000A52AD9C|nr:bifunctional DNA-binding transcriptional regulator/O6-methylguanine-DNA methyltransferase Ada [Alcanivorax sp. HI0044]